MKRFPFLLVVTTAGVVTAASPASILTQGSPSVRVYARAGLLAPDSYFYEHFENFAGDGLTEWTRTSLGRAAVAGIGAEMRLGPAATLRAEVLRSFDTWVSVSHSVETLRDLFIPPEIVTTWLDVPVTLTLTSVELLLPTRLALGAVAPYVLVGVGGKRYAFGAPTDANDVGATLPADGFTWGGDVGAGFASRFRGLWVDVQGRDAWSRYWGKLQHDFVFSGSVAVTAF